THREDLMTIEFSLRRRASRARLLGNLWVCLLAVILVGTFISLPPLASRLLTSVTQITGANPKADGSGKQGAAEPTTPPVSPQVFALTTLGLGVFAVCFGCYFLSRSALIELESAARLRGLADALCLAGGDMAEFER